MFAILSLFALVASSLLRPGQWWPSIVMSASVCMCLYVCVCLLRRISPEPHARCLAIFVWLLAMAVARSLSGKVAKSQGKGAVTDSLLTLEQHRH